MHIVIFTHSLASDWNHGHVHFLRGVVTALVRRGHDVEVFEPEGGWSANNLRADHGEAALRAYAAVYPAAAKTRRTYLRGGPYPLDAARRADAVIVQEWTEPALVRALARLRTQEGGPRLYFHDAHHRIVTEPDAFQDIGLGGFDAVLAFGDILRRRHLEAGWVDQAFTWHEAADTRVFRPMEGVDAERDLLWVGNWGDGERSDTYDEFLFGPVRRLGLHGTVHGVRYPATGRLAVQQAGLDFGGYLPNHRVPDAMARHRTTVHLPRRAYRDLLPGVPTIRVFEALACGMPLVCTPWVDEEGLFRSGDYLVAESGDEMTEMLDMLLDDETHRDTIGRRGLETIRARHTCDHRVEEFLHIDGRFRGGMRAPEPWRQDGHQKLSPAEDETRQGAARQDDSQNDVGGRSVPSPKPGLAGSAAAEGLAARSTGVEAAADGPHIAFFGSSLVSSYWNGAATYYRGLLASLARRGCRITFYEPDAYDRQAHRDIDDPDWAEVRVYPADGTAGVDAALEDARGADVVVKASGVGVHDAYLEREVLRLKAPDAQVVFWDVDAPATLDRIHRDRSDPFAALVSEYDFVCTYGGGPLVVEGYEAAGARRCVPIYNALDPSTHHPVAPDERFAADLSFLGNRLPDREDRVERFFLRVAQQRPHKRFLLGGNGWDTKRVPPNVRAYGHVPTSCHNAFNVSARAVLNINRDSMARYGHSPATRVFEAAGAGACIITDAFRGVESFFEPGREILVAQDGDEVMSLLDGLDPERAVQIGAAARRRAVDEHTYDDRAAEAMALFAAEHPEVMV